VFKGGWEYVAFIAVAAIALACLGPGTWSLDHLVGLTVSGLRWSIASLVAGLGGALFLLNTGRRTAAQPSAANRV
jgi:putative oxidoreductase